jgi:hypothetical protein
MDCEERDRLRTIHLDAVKRWTEAGDGNPMRRNDPMVVAAWAKVVEAVQAIHEHRRFHGC